ncbi:hypothetical protein RB195_000652 [Necator americanus]|uniref:Uncharacterized protein n=1 Tax=Necator americanus TaxID=51031 RepID=A0ABR1DAR9_NECAM
MDLLYNVEQMNETLHKVIAHITPLRCHEICWQSTLMADTGTATFAEDGARECHQIEGTNSTAFLRHMTRYTVCLREFADAEKYNTIQYQSNLQSVEKQGSGYELVVETELQEDSEEGLVTLAALNLGKDNNKVRTKTFRAREKIHIFSSKSSNRTFRLPLAEDSVYAVQYQYTKVKPFHYTTKEHFLVETIPGNSTDVSQPLIEAQFAMENHTTITGGVTQTPTVTLGRGDAYSNHEVVVRVDPQCEDTNISSTWTFGDDERQTNEKMDLTAAICYNYPKASFCDPARNYTTVCSQMLCYSAAVAIEGADYPSNVRCVNVTEHFPVDSVSSPIHVQISVLLLIFSLFFMLV